MQNIDDFRRALLDVEAMKQKIKQWTGHTNPASLELYINLDFEEVANFKDIGCRGVKSVGWLSEESNYHSS